MIFIVLLLSCFQEVDESLFQRAKRDDSSIIEDASLAKFVNRKDSSGYALIHYAAKNRNMGMIKALIAAGANIGILDPEGNKIIDYAFGDNEILKAIVAVLMEVVVAYATRGEQDTRVNNLLKREYILRNGKRYSLLSLAEERGIELSRYYKAGSFDK